MKIFHIVSNKEWGGGEQYVYDLSQRQRTEGIDVTIFCKPVEAIMQKYQEAGMTVIPLALGGALDIRSAWKMAKVIENHSNIHAHNFKDAFTACYAKCLAGNKQVRVVMCRHLTRKGKNTLLYRWLYTSIVVPETFEKTDLRREFQMPSDCVIGMFHGRLDPEKGLDTLLEAVAQIKDKPFRLVLVGRGSEDYTAHLHQMAEDKGISDKVIFAGFRHPVLSVVAAADFGILASTVQEGCPLSPQEYMSQGHPVVVTNNGGQREYVFQEHNGLLVPPGDAKALAEAITRLVDDAALRQRLGAQAKADFDDHLNYDHYYEQIKKIYEE